jgi:phosphatidate cytidylyltransferase
MQSGLRQRILTAVVLGLALLAVILWLPPEAALVVFACVVLVGAWEWSTFPRFPAAAARWFYVLIVGLAMFLVWRFSQNEQQLQTLLLLALGWWIVAFLWISLAPGSHNRATVAGSGLLVLVPAWVAIAHLYLQPGDGLATRGPQLVLFLLLLVWAADTGAFFAGRRFGRIKLAPRVSPSKTWEGVLGGLAAAVAVAAVGAWWFHLRRVAFLSLCLAVVLISIVGDLTESMFKRYAGVKDSGSIFPGHGGVLDRIDSITAAAPTFLLGLRWMEAQS